MLMAVPLLDLEPGQGCGIERPIRPLWRHGGRHAAADATGRTRCTRDDCIGIDSRNPPVISCDHALYSNAQSQHKSPPTAKVLATQQLTANTYLIVSNVNPSDGSAPLRAWTQAFVNPLSATGAYSMTLFRVVRPQQQSADQGNGTVKVLVAGYQANGQKIIAGLAAGKDSSDQTVVNIQRKTAASQAATNALLAANQRAFESQQ